MTLIKPCGAQTVTWGELDQMRTPPATATWFPLSHSQVLESVVQTLDKAGFQIRAMELAVTPDDASFFGTLQLQAEIAPGVALAVGCRNSFDKSLPIGFCCVQRRSLNLSSSARYHVNLDHQESIPGAHVKANDSFRAASTRSINASGR